ncbi:lactate utilization protein C [Corynebacterium xerosis]|uniref:Lactate utilization protein C n=1 Tax=Corynebacterium xerosis TaxID=1725 RepID=A0A6B8THM2_9CORY|nr:LUD domain-containing protein [Corynebacterium xerosis]QGS35164.1 lactate utilization protein C [Corynebacterium xerosis]
MSVAKQEILDRIREAHARSVEGRVISEGAGIDAGVPGEAYTVPRDYIRSRETPGAELVELLVDRLVDYRAEVIRCSASVGGSDGIGAAVAKVLADHGVGRVGIPGGLDEAWLGDFGADSGEIVVDDPAVFAARELDVLDGIVTSSAVTAAETGTIFLDGSPVCGRRALTLVPDLHVCVVPVDTIVDGVPESIARLEPTAPITMISGPSATSDIELNRVEGVHGPRTLVVVIAG